MTIENYSFATDLIEEDSGFSMKDFLGNNVNVRFDNILKLFNDYIDALKNIFPMFISDGYPHHVKENEYVFLVKTFRVTKYISVSYFTKQFVIENLTINLHYSDCQVRLEVFMGTFEENLELFKFNNIHNRYRKVINPELIGMSNDSEFLDGLFNFIALTK